MGTMMETSRTVKEDRCSHGFCKEQMLTLLKYCQKATLRREVKDTLPGKREQIGHIGRLCTHALWPQSPSGNGEVGEKDTFPIAHLHPSCSSSTLPEVHTPTSGSSRPPPVLREQHLMLSWVSRTCGQRTPPGG